MRYCNRVYLLDCFYNFLLFRDYKSQAPRYVISQDWPAGSLSQSQIFRDSDPSGKSVNLQNLQKQNDNYGKCSKISNIFLFQAPRLKTFFMLNSNENEISIAHKT